MLYSLLTRMLILAMAACAFAGAPGQIQTPQVAIKPNSQGYGYLATIYQPSKAAVNFKASGPNVTVYPRLHLILAPANIGNDVGIRARDFEGKACWASVVPGSGVPVDIIGGGSIAIVYCKIPPPGSSHEKSLLEWPQYAAEKMYCILSAKDGHQICRFSALDIGTPVWTDGVYLVAERLDVSPQAVAHTIEYHAPLNNYVVMYRIQDMKRTASRKVAGLLPSELKVTTRGKGAKLQLILSFSGGDGKIEEPSHTRRLPKATVTLPTFSLSSDSPPNAPYKVQAAQ